MARKNCGIVVHYRLLTLMMRPWVILVDLARFPFSSVYGFNKLCSMVAGYATARKLRLLGS